MKIKKILALLLASVLVFTLVAACAPAADTPAVDPTPAPAPTPTPAPAPPPAPPEEPPELLGAREELLATAAALPAPTGTLVFRASVAPDQNIWYGAHWTNMASNAQARMAMGGLGTMARNDQGLFFPDPIVMRDGAWPEISDDAEGNRTYTFTIYLDNQFSDGTFITAANYVAEIAFLTSPQWAALVPSAWDFPEVVGVEAWMEGEADTLVGVNLISEDQFSLTIAAEHLPYVWESVMFMGVGPLPIHAMGIEAHDDGNGVFLTGPGGTELTFEAVNLAVNGGNMVDVYQVDEDGEYVLDEDGNQIVAFTVGDGMRFNPTVSSGPYMFESVEVGGRLSIVANPYFRSTWDGYRPRIERVVWEYVPIATAIDALAGGQIDAIAAITDGGVITEAFSSLIDVASPTHDFNAYPQHGQWMIQFQVDHGATQFREVRAAMSYMIDRFEFAEVFGRGFATPTYMPGSFAEWFTVAAVDRGLMDQLIIYDLNMDEAIRLLDEGGWVYDANGNPFEMPGGNGNYRHKMVDGELMELHIAWVSAAADRPFRDAIELQLPDRMEYAGMRLTQDRDAGWGGFLSRADQEYNMFDVGITFGIPFRRWWNLDPATGPAQNWGNVDWPETLAIANRMRVGNVFTEEGQHEFVSGFMELMINQNYMLDTIPLVSLTAHDFIPLWLGNWNAGGMWSDGMAVVRAYDTRN